MNIVAPTLPGTRLIDTARAYLFQRFTERGRFVRRWCIPQGDGWLYARLTPSLAIEITDDAGRVLATAYPEWKVGHEL